MTHLSVNINKFATLRNARGGNNPDLIQVAKDCQRFGANGITVHPRPDERHIRYSDVLELAKLFPLDAKIEFNIEGNPKDRKFVDLVLGVKPAQVTLVPDTLNQLTSNHGWDTIEHKIFLQEIIALFQKSGIRVSIFVDPLETMMNGASETGTDRIELYTESYAKIYPIHREKAIEPYIKASEIAFAKGLGINAGHDLDLNNLSFFNQHIHHLQEVSIGHALVCDALYLGLENTIQLYKRCLIST